MNVEMHWAWWAAILSVVVVVVFAALFWQRLCQQRTYHDSRSRTDLLESMVLLAAGIGTMASAVGFLYQIETNGVLLTATGLASAMRGAMIVGGIALLMSRRKQDG